jgi:hypothetical protein
MVAFIYCLSVLFNPRIYFRPKIKFENFEIIPLSLPPILAMVIKERLT